METLSIDQIAHLPLKSAGPYLVSQAQLDAQTQFVFHLMILSAIAGALVVALIVYLFFDLDIPARSERRRIELAIFLYQLAQIREIDEQTTVYYITQLEKKEKSKMDNKNRTKRFCLASES